MPTATTTSPLLTTGPSTEADGVTEALLSELADLALSHDSLSTRSRVLFEQLRKMLGHDRLLICLRGLQSLAARGGPAGARLLAAFLDSNTSGSQLLPRVATLASTRRLACLRQRTADEGADLHEWSKLLDEAAEACRYQLGAQCTPPTGPVAPGEPPPLPELRRALRQLAPTEWDRRIPTSAEIELLARLVNLETEATQIRVGHLAGTIDPFRVSVVMRALPLLSRTDAEIRDLRNFESSLRGQDLEAAFRRRVPRFQEVMDESEVQQFAAGMHREPALVPLAGLHDALLNRPQSVPSVAGPLARLLALGRRLTEAGVRSVELDLVTATMLVFSHSRDGCLRIPLDGSLAKTVGQVLLVARSDGAASDWLEGLVLDAGCLVLRDPSLALGDRIWRHDLPTLEEMTTGAGAPLDAGEDPLETGELDEDTSQAAVKQMVMNNLGCVSIVLGFLRNPKIKAIPGLVADIARRSRSARVLEVIATDRALYSGFVNREVPRALIESPVNVPVKTLRKFIHVRYVSKADLKRMAQDKARFRKEIIAEINRYLDSLV